MPGPQRLAHRPIGAAEWVVAALVTLSLLLQARALVAGSPGDRAVALGFFSCLLTTAAAWRLRARLRAWGRPEERGAGRRFVLLGAVGAAWVETAFWAAERLCGAHGVAASANLLIDLLVTLPWYLGMLVVLRAVLERCAFRSAALALLGGLYEVGGDGIVGPFLDGRPITSEHLALLGLAYGSFIVVYSPIILPAYWAVYAGRSPCDLPTRTRAALALAPLLPLIPYALALKALFSLAPR